MRIIYLHQYFRTFSQSGPWRSAMIADAFAKNGHEVHLITSDHDHRGDRSVQKHETNFQIHRTNTAYSQSMGFMGRSLSFLKFAWRAFRTASKIKAPDLVYATSTPITVGITALLLNRFAKVPFVFEVRDLWPLVPIELGVLKNRALIKLLKSLEAQIYEQAEAIVCLSPKMEAYLIALGHEAKTHLVPNFSDLNVFRPRQDKGPVKKFCYCGSMGASNDVTFISEFFQKLTARYGDKVEIHIAGGGHLANYLKAKTEAFAHWHENLDRAETAKLMGECHFNLVSFADNKVFEQNSPNKFFDGMAAGCFSLLNTGGWLREMTETQEIGAWLDRHRLDQSVAGLDSIINDHQLWAASSQKARSFAEEHFNQPRMTEKIIEIIQNQEGGSID